MSDSEDDYMSDKLLIAPTQDIRPGLVFNRNLKRQYEVDKKRKELQAKKPKNFKELEHEQREKGLNTEISEDNKGFQMLAKMGFKKGEGLGKAKTGRVEPVKIEVRCGKSGIGVETHVKEKIQRIMKRNTQNMERTLSDFQQSNRIRQSQRFLHKDFLIAQKACEDLDQRNEVKEPVQEFFWTRDTIRKRRQIEEEEEVEEFNEEFSTYFTDENLCEIILYLRETHLYCIYCAFVASDAADLNTSCPGQYRSDHDDS